MNERLEGGEGSTMEISAVALLWKAPGGFKVDWGDHVAGVEGQEGEQREEIREIMRQAGNAEPRDLADSEGYRGDPRTSPSWNLRGQFWSMIKWISTAGWDWPWCHQVSDYTINYHKLGTRQQQEHILSQFRRPEVRNQGVGRCISLDSRGIYGPVRCISLRESSVWNHTWERRRTLSP